MSQPKCFLPDDTAFPTAFMRDGIKVEVIGIAPPNVRTAPLAEVVEVHCPNPRTPGAIHGYGVIRG